MSDKSHDAPGMAGDGASSGDLSAYVRERIDVLRDRLLDLSRRNPLVSTRFSDRSNAYIRVVDELPDILFFNLSGTHKMRLIPLPDLEQDPRDEQTPAFTDKLPGWRLMDKAYLTALDGIDPLSEDVPEKKAEIERALKDRLREHLRMPPRQTKAGLSLKEHARTHDISPSYDLPMPDEEHEDGRHTDGDIQTLWLQKDLDRKLRGLMSKCRSWQQETGLNVLQIAFGFLEWTEPASGKEVLSPLVLLSAQINRNKTPSGPEFWVGGAGNEPETNTVLELKLKLDCGVSLPAYIRGSIESYLTEVSACAPQGMKWRVRRQIAIGVFPSARMAMYQDLDTHPVEENRIVQKLFASAGDAASGPFAENYETDEPEIEGKVPYLSMDADSSQFSVLVDIASGKDLAVEGPPGTGKSQTIVNAITAAVAAGKKVLFVAQKKAALDVVKSRLEAVGLGEFLLPLLADRSSRRDVVETVRARIEMSAPRRPSELKEMKDAFGRARTELAGYLEILGTTVAGTDFTVHHVLGKSMSTAEALEEAPKAIALPRSDVVNELTESIVSDLKAAALHLVDMTRQAESIEPLWQGVQLEHPDRFRIAELTGDAGEFAGIIGTLCEKRDGLETIGFGSDLAAADLHALRELLVKLAERQDADIGLVSRLSDAGARAVINAFEGDLSSFNDLTNALDRDLVGVDEALDLPGLERLAECAHVFEQSGGSVRERADIARRAAERLRELSELKGEVAELIQLEPIAKSISFPDLQKIRQVLDDTPANVLELRTPESQGPNAAALIRRAIKNGRELLDRKESLQRVFSFDDLPGLDQLKSLEQTLSNAGVFGFLSSKVRKAKHLYLAISTTGSLDKGGAVVNLQRLIRLLEEIRAFAGDREFRGVMGVPFDGIKTDFDGFGNLLAFYGRAEDVFYRPSDTNARDFLVSGAVRALRHVPRIPDRLDAVTLTDLTAMIDGQQGQASLIERACSDFETLKPALKAPEEQTRTSLRELRNRAGRRVELAAALSDADDVKGIIGSGFAGAKTNPESFRWEIDAACMIDASGHDCETITNLMRTDACARAIGMIDHLVVAEEKANDAASDFYTKCGIHIEIDQSVVNLKAARDRLEDTARDPFNLETHARTYTARREFEGFGYGWILNALEEEGRSLERLPDIVEACLFKALASGIYAGYGSGLRRYTGQTLDKLRSDIARFDRKIIELARSECRALAYQKARPPQGVGRGRKSDWTELSLLNHEITKKRNIPVRQLTRRAGKALRELKPCWMMSPLAVAQYLPQLSGQFDLCIVDEASQMPPEDAIGAIARCGQVMVVGDTNQLPPTSFFRRMIDDEEIDEDLETTQESILEIANATLRPARRLRWHYRSRHSGLINFSNHHVYGGQLEVFPSANETASNMGVSLVEVDGLYRAGINDSEATKMVEEAVGFMRHTPDRSLGLVTLNQKQRDLVAEKLDHILAGDSVASAYIDHWRQKRDGLESFFIKNLENVQGDERDVIFISTVYGPESAGGTVMNRFGPITGVAGKRRLNVLFSRAKRQIVTFSSMTAGDIRAEEHGNPGAFMLKQWLEYARTGKIESGEKTNREPDSEFECFVINQITSMGCEATPQVGVAGYFVDIGVTHPDWPHGFLMGVECDGARYHSARSARDRDRLRQEVLEGLGWHLYRIWSTDWFNNQATEAAKLRDHIAQRLSELKSEAPTFEVAAPPAGYQQNNKGNGADTLNEETDIHPVSGNPEETIVAVPPPADKPVVRESEADIGDTIRLQYLGEEGRQLEITLSRTENDPAAGVTHVDTPLGSALLGAEIEVLVGSYVRDAKVLDIRKQETPPQSGLPSRPAHMVPRHSNPSAEPVGLSDNRQAEFDHGEREQTIPQRPEPEADRFYDSDYIPKLGNMALPIIDSTGPITFKDLSARLARLHGFRKTGSRIKSQVWKAVAKRRKHSRTEDEQTVFWPDGMDPAEVVPFRGLRVRGEDRSWTDIPRPELLGLAIDIMKGGRSGDPVDVMSRRLGLARLTRATRKELTAVIEAAKSKSSDH